ncbi:DUF4238 domain-containing protein [Streptomyces sp. NPDC018833]|uniref:DUF4238 domain-containing protein n=1 Tax=Streptomyces sp. NPDC018833 TaxID=3365053 RepID=UPI0037B35F87
MDGLLRLEGEGLAALRRIDETGRPPDVGSEDRELLSLYLAVQKTRTPRSRATMSFPGNVTAYAEGREVDQALVAEYLTRRHLGSHPSAREAEAAWVYYQAVRLETGDDPTHNDTVMLPLRSVEVCIPHFRARHWRLETSRKPNFLTSDAPLLLWKPHTANDVYRGFGLGDAQEIRFPISPTAQLVLKVGSGTSAEEVKLSRVARCNQELADSCDRVVVGHPDRHASLDKTELRQRGPTLRFDIAPGFQRNPDGTTQPLGKDILHLWTTRR